MIIIIIISDLEKCVGDAIAAFVYQLLLLKEEKKIQGGIYFPEEINNNNFRKNILEEISNDAIFYSQNYKNN